MESITIKAFHFKAKGHYNVKATHKSTLEITTDNYLTPRGDCIIGINSEVSAKTLPLWLKQGLKSKDSIVVIVVCSGSVCDSLTARGDPRLTLTDDRSLVIRKSTFIDNRTIAVESNKSARDLDRRLIDNLRKGYILDVYVILLKSL